MMTKLFLHYLLNTDDQLFQSVCADGRANSQYVINIEIYYGEGNKCYVWNDGDLI